MIDRLTNPDATPDERRHQDRVRRREVQAKRCIQCARPYCTTRNGYIPPASLLEHMLAMERRRTGAESVGTCPDCSRKDGYKSPTRYAALDPSTIRNEESDS